ncbi:MAG: ABC transporter ATP-binding protein [Clostridia bacterium]|nr:ABC transporter ATP-binding protein [Clostridia bacterium]
MKRFGPPRGRETLPAYLWKYRPQFIVSSVGGILYNTMIVLGPVLMGRLIDAAGGGTARQVWLSAAYFVGVTAFFQSARYVKRWFMRDQFNRVACDLRQTLIERTLGRPLPELEKESVGDLMSRTVGDITLVVDTVMTTLNEGWDTWLLMVSYFVALMVRDWRITLLASVMVPVTVLLAQNMRHMLYRYSMDARKAASASSTGLQRYLDAVAVLRLFGRERDEAERIRSAYERQARFSVREMLLQQAMLPVYALIAGLGIVVVIALGGREVTRGSWSVGTFNAFLVMFVAFSGRTRVAARVFNRWHGARAAWTRVREKMDRRRPEEPDGAALVRPDCAELAVEGLSFGVDGTEFLRDITFTARRGEIIGITGAVGSGKSQLAHALTGLYPYRGSIRLDGRELQDIPPSERRRRIAYAGHEQFLFSMSIRENILLGTEDPEPDSRLDDVLAAVALRGDLGRFPQGLDTPVGEKGARVSGGQRQRIAMARAALSQAPVLLLDDPFSAVDIATEEAIVEGLRERFADRITLLFTHRLTAFRQADRVLVLDRGRIVQAGAHDALAAQPGLYKDIYDAQAFLEGNGDA